MLLVAYYNYRPARLSIRLPRPMQRGFRPLLSDGLILFSERPSESLFERFVQFFFD